MLSSRPKKQASNQAEFQSGDQSASAAAVSFFPFFPSRLVRRRGWTENGITSCVADGGGGSQVSQDPWWHPVGSGNATPAAATGVLSPPLLATEPSPYAVSLSRTGKCSGKQGGLPGRLAPQKAKNGHFPFSTENQKWPFLASQRHSESWWVCAWLPHPSEHPPSSAHTFRGVSGMPWKGWLTF